MEIKAVRIMDELGRIIIPFEIRFALGWDAETKISINLQEEQLILKTYQSRCFLCGNEENLKQINNKCICQNCIDKINK